MLSFITSSDYCGIYVPRISPSISSGMSEILAELVYDPTRNLDCIVGLCREFPLNMTAFLKSSTESSYSIKMCVMCGYFSFELNTR